MKYVNPSHVYSYLVFYILYCRRRGGLAQGCTTWIPRNLEVLLGFRKELGFHQGSVKKLGFRGEFQKKKTKFKDFP